MALPLMPKLGEALYDPKPEDNMGIDTNIAEKPYHFTWIKKGMKLTLHKGESQKCKRVHYNHNGSKFEK